MSTTHSHAHRGLARVRVPAEAQQRDCTDRYLALAACAAVSAAATNLAYDAKANCDRDCDDEESAADRADCRAACRRTLNSELAAIAAAAASCVLNAPDCEVVQTINPPPIHPSGVARLNTTRMSASWPAVLGSTGTRSETEPEWDAAQFPRDPRGLHASITAPRTSEPPAGTGGFLEPQGRQHAQTDDASGVYRGDDETS